MASGTRRYTIRLSTSLYTRIEHQAAALETTPADYIRRAVENYLLGQHSLSESQLRLIRVGEYSQLALDTIICEQFPDFRERILAATDKRMRRYHGQG